MTTFEYVGNLQHIYLVGAGGTGAQIARIITRILYDLRARQKHIPALTIFDGDIVQEKNIGRQLFVEADLNRNKAQVIARRMSFALGIPVSFQPDHFTMQTAIVPGGVLFVGAVDSHEGRRAIAHHFDHKSHRSNMWLDNGNHDNAAQIVLGTSGDTEYVLKGLSAKHTSDLPHVGLLFPAMLKPERLKRQPAQPANCADDLMTGKQHLMINDLVAAAAGQYLYKLLNHQPVENFMTWIDGESLSMRSLPICAEEIEPLLRTQKRKKGIA